MARLAKVFPAMGKPWTKAVALPGGDFASTQSLLLQMKNAAPWAEPDLINRWLQTYGSDTLTLLAGIDSREALGEEFGAGLFAHEVDYLIDTEWARCAEDVLWRRTKLGYEFDKLESSAVEHLDRYIRQRVADLAPAEC